MSNFSFSHSVFKRLVLQTSKSQGLFEKRLKAHIISYFNFLPNDKFLDFSKVKAFADDKMNEAEMMISVSVRVENIVGKGENAGHQHFLLFPQCFHKALLLGVVKSWDCVVKSLGKKHFENIVENGQSFEPL